MTTLLVEHTEGKRVVCIRGMLFHTRKEMEKAAREEFREKDLEYKGRRGVAYAVLTEKNDVDIFLNEEDLTCSDIVHEVEHACQFLFPSWYTGEKFENISKFVGDMSDQFIRIFAPNTGDKRK
jgi:hypothetical protein